VRRRALISGRWKYQNDRIISHHCSSSNNSEAIENWISLRLFNNFACRLVLFRRGGQAMRHDVVDAFDLWTGRVVAGYQSDPEDWWTQLLRFAWAFASGILVTCSFRGQLVDCSVVPLPICCIASPGPSVGKTHRIHRLNLNLTTQQKTKTQVRMTAYWYCYSSTLPPLCLQAVYVHVSATLYYTRQPADGSSGW
jgi:hypothetical protein